MSAVLLGYALPGLAIALGLLLPLLHLRPKWRLRLLGKPLLMEVLALVLAWLMHGGTLVGGMAVVMSGLTMAVIVRLARRVWGYIAGGTYHPGWVKYHPDRLR